MMSGRELVDELLKILLVDGYGLAAAYTCKVVMVGGESVG